MRRSRSAAAAADREAAQRLSCYAVCRARRSYWSASHFRREANRAGLEVVEAFAFGEDYAETLRRWRRDFLARDGEVRKLGFDTRFMRIWEFYLAYCEAAFDTGSTDVVQFTLRRP